MKKGEQLIPKEDILEDTSEMLRKQLLEYYQATGISIQVEKVEWTEDGIKLVLK